MPYFLRLAAIAVTTALFFACGRASSDIKAIVGQTGNGNQHALIIAPVMNQPIAAKSPVAKDDPGVAYTEDFARQHLFFGLIECQDRDGIAASVWAQKIEEATANRMYLAINPERKLQMDIGDGQYGQPPCWVVGDRLADVPTIIESFARVQQGAQPKKLEYLTAQAFFLAIRGRYIPGVSPRNAPLIKAFVEAERAHFGKARADTDSFAAKIAGMDFDFNPCVSDGTSYYNFNQATLTLKNKYFSCVPAPDGSAAFDYKPGGHEAASLLSVGNIQGTVYELVRDALATSISDYSDAVSLHFRLEGGAPGALLDVLTTTRSWRDYQHGAGVARDLAAYLSGINGGFEFVGIYSNSEYGFEAKSEGGQILPDRLTGLRLRGVGPAGGFSLAEGYSYHYKFGSKILVITDNGSRKKPTVRMFRPGAGGKLGAEITADSRRLQGGISGGSNGLWTISASGVAAMRFQAGSGTAKPTLKFRAMTNEYVPLPEVASISPGSTPVSPGSNKLAPNQLQQLNTWQKQFGRYDSFNQADARQDQALAKVTGRNEKELLQNQIKHLNATNNGYLNSTDKQKFTYVASHGSGTDRYHAFQATDKSGRTKWVLSEPGRKTTSEYLDVSKSAAVKKSFQGSASDQRDANTEKDFNSAEKVWIRTDLPVHRIKGQDSFDLGVFQTYDAQKPATQQYKMGAAWVKPGKDGKPEGFMNTYETLYNQKTGRVSLTAEGRKEAQQDFCLSYNTLQSSYKASAQSAQELQKIAQRSASQNTQLQLTQANMQSAKKGAQVYADQYGALIGQDLKFKGFGANQGVQNAAGQRVDCAGLRLTCDAQYGQPDGQVDDFLQTSQVEQAAPAVDDYYAPSQESVAPTEDPFFPTEGSAAPEVGETNTPTESTPSFEELL